MNQRLLAARAKYMPDRLRLIFITMAPPPASAERHFYYEDVDEHDSNFIEMMKVLYPQMYNSHGDTSTVRLHKAEFLEQFQDDGYYLMEAKETPISGERESELRAALPTLVKTLYAIKADSVPLVLVYKPVYMACATTLKKYGFNVINDDFIPGGQGHQNEFRRKLRMLLNKYRLMPTNG